MTVMTVMTMAALGAAVRFDASEAGRRMTPASESHG